MPQQSILTTGDQNRISKLASEHGTVLSVLQDTRNDCTHKGNIFKWIAELKFWQGNLSIFQQVWRSFIATSGGQAASLAHSSHEVAIDANDFC